MIKLIGFSGKARSGKDSAGMFAEQWLLDSGEKVVRQNLAEALKKYCAAKYNIPIDYFYNNELKEKDHYHWGVSPRKILQFEGTEATRDVIHKLLPIAGPSFWIHRLQFEVEDKSKYFDAVQVYCIICDIRFQNEADWILNTGGLLIDIQRPGADGSVGLTNHASEQGYTVSESMKGLQYHEVINDGTLSNLKAKISMILLQGLPK